VLKVLAIAVATASLSAGPVNGIAACAHEDGGPTYPCRWDATTQGNHRGHSITYLEDVSRCETVTEEDGYVYCDG
jgi:hypothetical protein